MHVCVRHTVTNTKGSRNISIKEEESHYTQVVRAPQVEKLMETDPKRRIKPTETARGVTSVWN